MLHTLLEAITQSAIDIVNVGIGYQIFGLFETPGIIMHPYFYSTPIILVLVVISTLQPMDTVAQPLSEFKSTHTLPDTIAANDAEILVNLLGSSLQSLADKDRRGRKTGGYVLLGLGAGTALGGIATLAFGEGDDARIVGISLLGGGAFLSGLSLLPFKIKSESERIYDEFRREPIDTPDQLRHKYYYWDRRFEELAQKSRQERIIGGVTAIVAAGVTSVALVEGTSEDRLHTFIWPALGGVTSILVKSDVERRYDTYVRAKEDLLRHQASVGAEVDFGIMPLLEGGMLGKLVVRF